MYRIDVVVNGIRKQIGTWKTFRGAWRNYCTIIKINSSAILVKLHPYKEFQFNI